MTPPRHTPDVPWPTKAELDILQVLWDRGASTVRDVHEALYGSDGAGYTTALKLMQIMHAKGLVERDDSQRAHIYRAAISKQRTARFTYWTAHSDTTAERTVNPYGLFELNGVWYVIGDDQEVEDAAVVHELHAGRQR